MIAQISTDDERGSGRRTPPAYTWVDQGYSCIVYDWIGGSSYETGTRQVSYLYRLAYQIRGLGSSPLGQIERLDDGWHIRAIARSLIPTSESVPHPTWEEARDYLWEIYQSSKRRAVREAA